MAKTTNLQALEKTLACLQDLGRIEDVDSAQLQALRSMAAALDADPTKAALWREYLDALSEVRRADDDANSGLADALAKVRSAAPMGNTPPV
jgi:hypothetical protein